jgi:NTE family protein
LLENLAFFLPDVRVEDTRIPFAAVATDLETGEEVAIRSGSLLDAVYASCTVPGVVEACRLEGRLLVDGGVIAMVPVRAARDLGAEMVIGVNAERCIGASIEGLSGVEIIFRADDIMAAELTRCQTCDVDVLVQPGVGESKWYEFQKTPEYIAIGEWAAREKMPEILRVLEPRRPSGLLGRAWKR